MEGKDLFPKFLSNILSYWHKLQQNRWIFHIKCFHLNSFHSFSLVYFCYSIKIVNKNRILWKCWFVQTHQIQLYSQCGNFSFCHSWWGGMELDIVWRCHQFVNKTDHFTKSFSLHSFLATLTKSSVEYHFWMTLSARCW